LATTDGMRPLHPDQVKLLRLRFAIFALALLAAAAAADLTFLRETVLPYGIVTAAGLAAGVAAVLVMPKRRYRAWAWRMDEDELRIASGVMIRSDTIVPYGRVQHIDVLRGPIQRGFGLASLVLHTAGTRSAAVLLPGLDADEAERIRDHIRGKIREDLV
jgi:membrane protein YdbS with pleckstrin-like domain